MSLMRNRSWYWPEVMRKKIRPKERAKDVRLAEADIKAELVGPESDYYYDPHVYDGERCFYCNVNVYDDSIYGPFECIEGRDQMTYTTETPQQEVNEDY